jgi:hypothetical protein
VEMLVVITIIGILVALLLPAVQSARESARRSACTNNLKQISLAMQKYESATGAFPAASLAFGYDGATINQGWMVYLLPHLEQPDLYRLYDRDINWYDGAYTDSDGHAHPGNHAAIATRVGVFECPSSPLADRVVTGTSEGAWLDPVTHAPIKYTAATTDYGGCTGLMRAMVPAYAAYAAAGQDASYYADHCGAVGLVKGRKATEIPDGLSNTLMINEMAGRPQYWMLGKADLSSTFLSSNLNICGAWAASNSQSVRGFTFDGTVSPGPFTINIANARGGIYAFHPGGANSAFADASVHFLKEDIDVHVLVGLVTRDGHEGLQPGDF